MEVYAGVNFSGIHQIFVVKNLIFRECFFLQDSSITRNASVPSEFKTIKKKKRRRKKEFDITDTLS